MAIAKAAISCSVAGWPKSSLLGYPCAHAGPIESRAKNIATALARRNAAASTERMHIFHTPVCCNAPALDRVHVIKHARWLEWTAFGYQLLMGRLRVAGFVGGAALQYGGGPGPNPRGPGTGLRDREDPGPPSGQGAGLAAVRREFQAPSFCPAGAGQNRHRT